MQPRPLSKGGRPAWSWGTSMPRPLVQATAPYLFPLLVRSGDKMVAALAVAGAVLVGLAVVEATLLAATTTTASAGVATTAVGITTTAAGAATSAAVDAATVGDTGTVLVPTTVVSAGTTGSAGGRPM